MILDVDGKQTEEPDDAAIAREFLAIDKRTGFRGGGLSLVILSKNKENSLTTSGHPVEGWMALLHEKDGITSSANPSRPLSQEEIIKIFQSYARGDLAWEKEFEWSVIEGKLPVKRIIVLIVVLLVVLLSARACAK